MGLSAATAQTQRPNSTPAGWKHFPAETRAPAGAPNVLLIMTDDVGFGTPSTFGGPVPTPAFDELAAHGLRYNQFHTTAMCSPSRAALLTGRNHHSVNSATVAYVATDDRGYTSVMDEAEHDVLAYMTFPKEHRIKLHSTNPIERLNGEIKRRCDVVGIFPNDDAIIRLVGAILLEQNDEWTVQRGRYITLETIAQLSDDPVLSMPAVAS
ncbi:transposase [Asticcacaulis sp. W401b]|uniref:transposase n=1 Tax=Asticcacaulis sp. W401b TaxID=3388666 RepID=UPI0039708F68